MNTNGKAAKIDAVCNAPNPPCHSNTAAVADCTNPQASFTRTFGLRLPPVVCMPNTNVAEAAEVMKKVLINKIASSDVINDNG